MSLGPLLSADPLNGSGDRRHSPTAQPNVLAAGDAARRSRGGPRRISGASGGVQASCIKGGETGTPRHSPCPGSCVNPGEVSRCCLRSEDARSTEHRAHPVRRPRPSIEVALAVGDPLRPRPTSGLTAHGRPAGFRIRGMVTRDAPSPAGEPRRTRGQKLTAYRTPPRWFKGLGPEEPDHGQAGRPWQLQVSPRHSPRAAPSAKARRRVGPVGGHAVAARTGCTCLTRSPMAPASSWTARC